MATIAKFSGSEVKFALTDPGTAIAPLFRPLTRGPRPQGLIVNVQHSGHDFKFTCYEWLDTFDQSILLSIIGMAGMGNVPLYPDTTGAIGQKLWSSLRPADSALEAVSVVVSTTCYALLSAAGFDDKGRNYQRLNDALYRLSQVGCRVKKDNYQWSMQMLSFHLDTDLGTVEIALNSRLAHAICGESAQYIRIELDERRAIKGDTAKVLHSWACVVTNVGQQSVWLGIDTLCKRVWGVDAKGDALRKRRERLKEAMAELESQGWKIEKAGARERLKIRFTRPNVIGH